VTPPALHIQSLCKTYGSKTGGTVAVENLNLTIHRGEIFGLLGPNGAGKTTTVRMICGLIPPSSGRIEVDGLSVPEHPSEVRARIGLLPEDAGDYKNLKLAEELEYHGAMFGLTPATVRERSRPLLDRLGLKDRSHHRLKTFSRGMRRKFHLIRALLHRPALLLLDEPTAGLDPAIVEDVWDLMKEAAAEHQVTIVLCSHHLEEVERLCTRVAILQRKLLIEGTLAELAGGNGRHRLQVAGDATDLIATVASVPGVSAVTAEGPVIRFSIAGPVEQILPAMVQAVVNAGGRLIGLSPEERDLRSLYRSFVGVGQNQPPSA
jgi:ABC-2 type transport system ATP-binding protein